MLLTKLDGASEMIPRPPPPIPYLCEVQAMEACILDGAAPVVPLALSRDFARTVLAIYGCRQRPRGSNCDAGLVEPKVRREEVAARQANPSRRATRPSPV